MPRYFLEVAYRGTNYSGFQVQQNAKTIQSEIEKAVEILQRKKIILTGSSRTDAGVHALQNYFHFDSESEFDAQFVYQMNSILPPDIVIHKVKQVDAMSHCRFDAESREYKYFIYRYKNPFLNDRGFYFPYGLNMERLCEAAALISEYSDFTSFSKRKTQAKTFICDIKHTYWIVEADCLVFYIKANRFLRGMVRALVATQLKLGREKITIDEFRNIIEAKDCMRANFAVPARGLFLVKVNYPESYLNFEL
jgi:tRNA pseudouridine38-40 synthase